MKNYIIAFILGILIISTIGTAILMLMLPQTNIDTSNRIEEYISINKEDFTFENSKNITNEKMEKKYKVTSEDLKNFKKKYMYKPGNVNPFSSELDVYNESIKKDEEDTKTEIENSNNGNGNSSNTNK